MPQTHIPWRGYGAPHQTPLPSALRRFAPTLLARAFGPSIVSPSQQSWIHTWAHPPSENPSYAYDI